MKPRFIFEFRSNGLAYVTVMDEQKTAGSFSLAAEEAERLEGVLLARDYQVESVGREFIDRPNPAPRRRKR